MTPRDITTAAELADVIDRVANAATLLVATDFDGVIAPHVDDPLDVDPLIGSLDALNRLSAASNTQVAYVSGRDVNELAALVRAAPECVLIGGHGRQRLDEPEPPCRSEAALAEVACALEARFAGLAGVWVEPKRYAAAVHLRTACIRERSEVASALAALAAAPGIERMDGHNVIEYRASGVDKGDAVLGLACDPPRTIVYFGDDRTDEDVFRRLRPNDLGFKIGQGQTTAGYRLRSPVEVTCALQTLAAKRCGSAEARVLR